MHKFKNPVVVLFFTVGNIATVTAADMPLNGHWEATSTYSGTTFSIDLHQSGSIVVGQYCAVGRNGGKIDCDIEDSPNIRGVFNNQKNEYLINFCSFFGGENGQATVRVLRTKLIWHVTKWPLGGPSFAPKDSVLTLQ